MTKPTKGAPKRVAREAAHIVWVDSASFKEGTWTDKEDLKDLVPEETQAIGFVVAESDDHLTIASHVSEHEVGGEIAIPKCAIKKSKRWKVK